MPKIYALLGYLDACIEHGYKFNWRELKSMYSCYPHRGFWQKNNRNSSANAVAVR